VLEVVEFIMHGNKPIRILERFIYFLGFYTRYKSMMRTKVRELPPCGDPFTNTPNHIFQRDASSSEGGLNLLLTASTSIKRCFLRNYLIIFMIVVLVLVLTSWISLIIKWPIAMEFGRIFILALIIPGDSGIQVRRLWYRPETPVVCSLSLVQVLWVFSR
jgi:hypothetical protein